MKVCTIHGDMTSSKSSENYPTEVFCNECYMEMNVDNENNTIIGVQEWNSSWADFCSKCEKTRDDELGENE